MNGRHFELVEWRVDDPDGYRVAKKTIADLVGDGWYIASPARFRPPGHYYVSMVRICSTPLMI